MNKPAPADLSAAALPLRKPRLGFIGVGWIGRHRMEAMLAEGAVEAAVIVEPADDHATEAAALAPAAERVASFEAALEMDLDGLVIATPSALHADQSRRALERGLAVFCQKPLGRTATEVSAVVEAARAADRLLAVDLSYRFTAGMQDIRELVRAGDIGKVFAVDLTFHNAYGPDKAWFYDAAMSGGGCVMDLGVHLVDLALWVLDFPAVTSVAARLTAGGAPLEPDPRMVEDHAVAQLDLANGAGVRLACSWRLHAGQDAIIEAAFYGDRGGLVFRNCAGSFYDFTSERFRGTTRETLSSPPDTWGGRAAVDWARRLAAGCGFDPEAERLVQTAAALDAIYGRSRPTG